jgi:hypothetical protein
MALEDFLSLPGLPDMFGTVTVSFVFEDGSQQVIQLPSGGSLEQSQLPALAQKPGFEAQWEGLAAADLTNILYDTSFHALYTPYRATIQSAFTRENSLPLVLAEGSFAKFAEISAQKLQVNVPLRAKEQLLEAWALTLPEGTHTARLLLPGQHSGNIKLLLSENGSWRAAKFTKEGSYLVFSAAPGELQLALVQQPVNTFPWLAVGAAAAALALGAALLIRKRKGKKEPKQEQPKQETAQA